MAKDDIRLSPSGMSTREDCVIKAYLYYNLRKHGTLNSKSARYAVQGTIAHHINECFNRYIIDSIHSRSEKSKILRFKDNFNCNTKKIIDRAAKDSLRDDEYQVFLQERMFIYNNVKIFINNYFDYCINILRQNDFEYLTPTIFIFKNGGKIIGIEAELESLVYYDSIDRDVVYNGKADLITEKSGEVFVLDYKSSNTNIFANRRKEYDFQIKFYKIMLNNIFKNEGYKHFKNINVGIIYLQNMDIDIDRSGINDIKFNKHLEAETIKAVEQYEYLEEVDDIDEINDNYKCTTDSNYGYKKSFCFFCQYYRQCKYK